LQSVFKGEVTGEGQEPFIRYRQSDDSEHEQGEDAGIAMSRDPLKSNLSHLIRYTDLIAN
jgi:hypothetical protein